MGEAFSPWTSLLQCHRVPGGDELAVVVVPGKYQRQLPAAVTVTLVLRFPWVPDVTVLTVL
ncbi:hypothetical protein ACFY1B_21960 [Streptomyces mirabilis]|uniref:hypothetical protein n=1 Tax=Streptomyces mirabilis TaxID=68239 RepID=UPI0036C60515